MCDGLLPASAISSASSSLTRTGDKLSDDLNLFETQCFYDCTFKIINEAKNESKVRVTDIGI